MRYWLFAATIVFSTFAIVSSLVSLAVARLAPLAAERLERYSAGSRAALLFRVRLLPAVLASIASLAIVLPIFLVYEPPDTDESLPLTLLAFGLAGSLLVARGAWRAILAWHATRELRLSWQARGRRVAGFETTLPLFAIDESFPTVAVIGVVKPALFISERVLRECPPEEIRAMLRHEAAHVTVRDNLKRFLIRACPDLLSRGGTLDRAWAFAAEEAADAAAAADQPGTAVELAQALVRVARLAPAAPAPELVSAFYVGGSIESRVRHLIGAAPSVEAPARPGLMALVSAGLCMATLVVLGASSLHQVMEFVVRQLP